MISVLIDGIDIKEFESLSFSRSLDSLCGQFEIKCYPSLEFIQTFKAGSSILIRYDKKPVFTGVVDTISSTLGPEEKSFSISGRDLTSTLVDSSVIHKPMGFDSITLSQLAKSLCKPFGIEVKSNLKTETHHPNWYLFYGETVFEALDRMAKIDGVLFMTSETGELLIAKPTVSSDSFVSIQQGKSLYEISFTSSQKGRYRTYKLTTFAQGLGNSMGVIKELTDSSVKFNKTLIIDSEGLASGALAKSRLDYEMRTRNARSTQITAHVPGWVDLKGIIFKLNQLASVQVEALNLYEHYLISSLSFMLDKERGYSTEITLCLPDAFIPDPAAEIRLNSLFDLLRKDKQNEY